VHIVQLLDRTKLTNT